MISICGRLQSKQQVVNDHMSLWAKVRQGLHTVMADLFSEETETAVPDRATAFSQSTQRQLDDLRNELAMALAREKQAENVWRTAQAQGQPFAADLEGQHQTFVKTITALQAEIDRLERQLAAITSQSAHLDARAENVAMQDRLQKLQKELDKTAVSLHEELADRQEQIALREDLAAAREEIRAAHRDADL
jgi:chromosome segregation ATPase